MTEYRFYREGSGWENVAPERWRWVATYTDGSQLKQFDDETGLFHQFREIEQDRLARFDMVSLGKPPIVLQWSTGRKLIHFYSNTILDFFRDPHTKVRVYCFGYEEPGHKVIIMIMPDDGIVITEDHNRVKIQ